MKLLIPLSAVGSWFSFILCVLLHLIRISDLWASFGYFKDFHCLWNIQKASKVSFLNNTSSGSESWPSLHSGTPTMLSNLPGLLLLWRNCTDHHAGPLISVLAWIAPWVWPKKGLSPAVYPTRARAWNFLLLEKFLLKIGSRISNLSLFHRGPLVLEDKFEVLHWLSSKVWVSFVKEIRKAHSQSKLTGSNNCLSWLNLLYIFGFINPVNLVIQDLAGSVKDGATGVEGNMVRLFWVLSYPLKEEFGGT